MNRIVLFFAILIGLSSSAMAVTREAVNKLENQSNFGNVAVSGSNTTGNPGYYAVVAPDSSGANFTYYLWVDTTGDWCTASYPTISGYASFPSGDWRTGMPCTVVGGQS